MKIEYTENGSLNYDTEHFEELSRGIVIFPENLKEVEKIDALKELLENIKDTPNDAYLGAKIRKLLCQ